MDHNTIFFTVCLVADMLAFLQCKNLQEETATLFNEDGTDNITIPRKRLFSVIATGLFWIIVEICLGVLFLDVCRYYVFFGIVECILNQCLVYQCIPRKNIRSNGWQQKD